MHVLRQLGDGQGQRDAGALQVPERGPAAAASRAARAATRRQAASLPAEAAPEVSALRLNEAHQAVYNLLRSNWQRFNDAAFELIPAVDAIGDHDLRAQTRPATVEVLPAGTQYQYAEGLKVPRLVAYEHMIELRLKTWHFGSRDTRSAALAELVVRAERIVLDHPDLDPGGANMDLRPTDDPIAEETWAKPVEVIAGDLEDPEQRRLGVASLMVQVYSPTWG